MKNSTMQAKALIVKKFHKRRIIEDELILQGLMKPKTFAKYYMDLKEAELIAEEQSIKARGFCVSCYMIRNYEGKCTNPSCSQFNQLTVNIEQEWKSNCERWC